jgi:hypothetical protein
MDENVRNRNDDRLFFCLPPDAVKICYFFCLPWGLPGVYGIRIGPARSREALLVGPFSKSSASENWKPIQNHDLEHTPQHTYAGATELSNASYRLSNISISLRLPQHTICVRLRQYPWLWMRLGLHYTPDTSTVSRSGDNDRYSRPVI